MYLLIAFIFGIVIMAMVRESKERKAAEKAKAIRYISQGLCTPEERANLMAYHGLKEVKRGLAPR